MGASLARCYHEPNSSSAISINDGSSTCYAGIVFKLLGVALGVAFITIDCIAISNMKDSVITVQIAFNGDADQIHRDLNGVTGQIQREIRFSMVTNSESTLGLSEKEQARLGLQLLLSETVSCISRYPESCFSAYSEVNLTAHNFCNWVDVFDQTYLKERNRSHAPVKRATCPSNKYLVVTILVAAAGIYPLPAIKNLSDLYMALNLLTDIRPRLIKDVKVFWTFRDDIEDFPRLKSLWS